MGLIFIVLELVFLLLAEQANVTLTTHWVESVAINYKIFSGILMADIHVGIWLLHLEHAELREAEEVLREAL